jgi:transketolase
MQYQYLTQVYGKSLVQWAKSRPELIVFSGDLTGSTEISDFKNNYPDRFFNLGMAEQNMMSFAGGMAREGYTPFVHTFAVFMYRRALDQIEMSIAYPNLKVRMMGFLPGILTPGGVSHQAINDIGVLRSLPNLTLIEAADATDLETMFPVLDQIDGPVYVRVHRKEVPRLFPATQPFQLNRVRVLSEGSDLTLVTSGICTEEALRVTALLKKQGVNIEHLHVSTHKPFSDPQVARSCAKSPHVITMENHSIYNGLASEVAEAMALNGVGATLHRIGLQDTYAYGATERHLMRVFGLDGMALAAKIEDALGAKFGLQAEQLSNVRLSTAGIAAEQLEAL